MYTEVLEQLSFAEAYLTMLKSPPKTQGSVNKLLTAPI